MSVLNLRLNEVKDKFGKLNQVIVIKLKAQWLSDLELRLNVAENKLEKSSQISAYSLKAQWLSGLKLRLSTCLRPTQLCGGRPTKRKSFDFLLLVYSQLCGGGQTKRKSFDFLLLVHSLFNFSK